MTTNLAYTDLEDAVVEKLSESSLMEGRVVAVTSPFMDVDELPMPPLVAVAVNSEERRREGNAIGTPLVIKTDVTVHVMVIATWFRLRGDSVGAHELIATIKDELTGWQPSALADVKRPFVLGSSALYDHDEERRLLFWLMEWETMILVREPI